MGKRDSTDDVGMLEGMKAFASMSIPNLSVKIIESAMVIEVSVG